MKPKLLIVIILSAVLLSIYLNHIAPRREFRIINLLTEPNTILIAYNGISLPYPLPHNSSTEYIILPRISNKLELKIIADQHEERFIDIRELAAEKLHTIVLYGNLDDIRHKQSEESKNFKGDTIIINYFALKPISENYQVSARQFDPANRENRTTVLLDEETSVKLSAGRIEFLINYGDAETKAYSTYLLSGERYRLYLYENTHNAQIALSMFVDNYPGDHSVDLEKIQGE